MSLQKKESRSKTKEKESPSNNGKMKTVPDKPIAIYYLKTDIHSCSPLVLLHHQSQ